MEKWRLPNEGAGFLGNGFISSGRMSVAYRQTMKKATTGSFPVFYWSTLPSPRKIYTESGEKKIQRRNPRATKKKFKTTRSCGRAIPTYSTGFSWAWGQMVIRLLFFQDRKPC